MRDKIAELKEMVRDGIITSDIAEQAIAKIQEKVIMEKGITMPTITAHTRKNRIQYTCMMPANLSRDGKRHQITGSTEEECKKKWRAAMCDVIENGTHSTPVTLGELMEEWMSKKRDVKKQTLAGYHSHYENHIKNKEFAKLKIKEIKLQDCKDIIADVVNFREKKDNREVGLGYNTVRHIKSEISMALDYAVANDYIRANYMKTVKINQGLCDSSRSHESRAWSDEKLQQLHQTAAEEWDENKKYRYSAVLFFMAASGLRAGECCALQWSDYDSKNHILTINKTLTSYRDYDEGVHVQAMSTPKTADSVRKIELTAEAIYWFKEIKRRQVESGILTNYVVSTRNGKIANQRDLNVRFQTFCKVAGVEYNPTHACRRSYTSVLYDGGVPVSEIARDLGHKKITTTLNSYYKPRATKNMMDKKNSVLSAAITAPMVTAVTAAGGMLKTR